MCRRQFWIRFLLVTFCLTLGRVPFSAFALNTYLTIGTGSQTGVYYPVGGAIAKLVNSATNELNLRLTVESTSGSVFNINALSDKKYELGIAQSDREYQAWKGLADWEKKGEQESLRGVLSLHAEILTLVASDPSRIKTCGDLKGKRVSVGNPGSGTYKNSQDALSTCGLTLADLDSAEGLKASLDAKMLQDGLIDAYFFMVGHPNDGVRAAMKGSVPIRFIPFPDSADLLKSNPYYSTAKIPVNLYPGVLNKEDVDSFGVKALLLTHESVSEEIIYAVTKSVFERLEDFKLMHPALKELIRTEMIQGMTSPLHPGAIKFYKEVGLIQ